jgi:hypothetical protein
MLFLTARRKTAKLQQRPLLIRSMHMPKKLHRLCDPASFMNKSRLTARG